MCSFPRSPWESSDFMNVPTWAHARDVMLPKPFSSVPQCWAVWKVWGESKDEGSCYCINLSHWRGFSSQGYTPVAGKCQKAAFAGAVFRLTVVWVGAGPGGRLPGSPGARKPHMSGLRGAEACPLSSPGAGAAWQGSLSNDSNSLEY